MVPDQVTRWIRMEGYGEIEGRQRVGGGCINHGMRIITTSGLSFFLKSNSRAPKDMFACEAEGLNALSVSGAPRVPRPFLIGETFLLLEDLAPSRPVADYWASFGRRLAVLHNHVGDTFGFPHNNYIGSTPQPNPQTADGHQFFAEQRLLFQTSLARQQGLLNAGDESQVRSLINRLDDLVPAQPPSLIHGDLWSGNAIADAQGEPALIDPAAHFGWGEAELGMTSLFGGFPEAFYQAYQEVRPLEPGYRERFSIYNLYHLLNHVNLFGTGYLGRTRAILSRFA